MKHHPQGAISPIIEIHKHDAMLQVVGPPSGQGVPTANRLHVGHGITGTVAAAAAMVRDGSRMSFVRDRIKDHGLRAKMEGNVRPGELQHAVHWGRGDAGPLDGRIIVHESPLVSDPIWPPQSVPRTHRVKKPIGAVRPEEYLLSLHHGRFITAAGKEVSTYYDAVPAVCDADTVNAIAKDMFHLLDGCDAVVAPAYGGIPFAVALAAMGTLPVIIIDVTALDTGAPRQAEDSFIPRAAMIVDDFTSVGSTFRKCIAHLQRLGGGTRALATVGAIKPGIFVDGHKVHAAHHVGQVEA